MHRFHPILLLVCLLFTCRAGAEPAHLPSILVGPGGHYLQTSDGRPFFWLGDTAWELIHSTTREECTHYLRTRARQGFTIIQTVVLSEGDGLRRPSALGLLPFDDADPDRPVKAYFDRVAEIADEAEAQGLYLALLPSWADKMTAPWGAGPRVFHRDQPGRSRAYARHLGARLKGRGNLVWMLGGDRPAWIDPQLADEWIRKQAEAAGFPPGTDWRPLWREFAAGLEEGMGCPQVFLYHPQGGAYTTSRMLPREAWLTINGMQSGHGGGHDMPNWDWVAHDYSLSPAKPTLDLEPNYEDCPYNPWPSWNPANGYYRDHDVRKQAYRSVFAGACGVTYGHHAVWGFVGERNQVINHTDRDWIDALQRPGGRQMLHLRELIESRPFFSRIPDQGLLSDGPGEGGFHLQATRDTEGTYALVYFPLNDQRARIDLSRLRSRTVRAWWFDPRTGFRHPAGDFENKGPRSFQSPPHGPDWVLMLEDPSCHYPSPGLPVARPATACPLP